ncbi:endolytic transglycosylase MltG [Candidatus Collierbacteria bacterium]|nr:endolytic transglycosylase MltG [Candidatus Collierbacteria bacterium]
MCRYLTAIFLVFAIIATMAFSLYAKPVNPANTSRIEFVITPGQTVDQIANNLSKAGFIRSRTVFKFTIFRLNLGKKIQAGYFSLSQSQNTTDIAQSLIKASTRQVWVTIPEGLRREEVANLILDKLAESKILHNFDPEEFVRKTVKLEGRLFPDTYALPENVTTQAVIDRLTSQFTQVTSSLNIAPEQLNRVVILASLVEREAGRDSERAEVAGIIAKRVENRWPLQVDATVQYAISSAHCRIRICDWWPKSLTKADLAFASPYNTYLNTGLPPAPIDNPGKASLSAAAKPNITKNWFYLHDTNGQIHYAVTIEEHNQNICTYLKKDC